MRKILFLLVAALWIVAGLQFIQNTDTGDEEEIVQAFRQTNCLDMEGSVTAVTELDGYRTVGEQEEMLKALAGQLGITAECEVSMDAVSGRNVVEICKEAAGADTALRIVTLEQENGNEISTKQYFRAEITVYDNVECALYYKKDLERILAEYGENADIRIELYGELPGSYETGERQDKIDELLDAISATACRSFEEGDVYTVYAYTRGVDGYKWINGDKVNVNAAVTYDEIKDCTCFYLAVPVIDGDY